MQYFSRLALLAAFLMPIKLSLSYIALVPGLLLWIADQRKAGRSLFSDLPSPVFVPYLLWLAIVVAGTAFGVNALRTLDAIGTLILTALVPPLYLSTVRAEGAPRVLGALFLGQGISSLHSVFERYLPADFQRVFVGTLSESGQLAVSAVIAFGTLFLIKEREVIFKRDLLIGALNLFLMSVLALKQAASFQVVWLAAAVATSYSCVRAFKFARLRLYSPLLTLLLLPILSAALVANLKRGPWLGVLCGTLILLTSIGRKKFIYFIACAAAVLLFVAPVRDRLMASYNHFVLAGGRMTMWEVGVELAAKFPLGIGYENSRFMRELDPEIPPSHTHFHSNPINILVETGWLGLACLLWAFVELMKISFSTYRNRHTTIIARTIGAALISWQVAGLVEYNFGDTEVLMIAYLAIGVMMGAPLEKDALSSNQLARHPERSEGPLRSYKGVGT